MKDQEILDEEPLIRPERPEAFDEAAQREAITVKAKGAKRRPGINLGLYIQQPFFIFQICFKFLFITYFSKSSQIVYKQYTN